MNPRRERKMGEVARRYGIDEGEFGRVGRRVRWVWPLLP